MSSTCLPHASLRQGILLPGNMLFAIAEASDNKHVKLASICSSWLSGVESVYCILRSHFNHLTNKNLAHTVSTSLLSFSYTHFPEISNMCAWNATLRINKCVGWYLSMAKCNVDLNSVIYLYMTIAKKYVYNIIVN